MACRPHPIPFANVGDIVRWKKGNKSGKNKILEVATGQGWPCYRINYGPYVSGEWIGHESILP